MEILFRHLDFARHGILSVRDGEPKCEQYRARWSLPRDHPMTAPGYSEQRSILAKQFGLGRGIRASREEPEPVAFETPAPP
jgi:predicted transcriptional regulator